MRVRSSPAIRLFPKVNDAIFDRSHRSSSNRFSDSAEAVQWCFIKWSSVLDGSRRTEQASESYNVRHRPFNLDNKPCSVIAYRFPRYWSNYQNQGFVEDRSGSSRNSLADRSPDWNPLQIETDWRRIEKHYGPSTEKLAEDRNGWKAHQSPANYRSVRRSLGWRRNS